MKKLLVIALLAFCTAAFGQQKKLVVTPFENRDAKLEQTDLDNLHDFLINAFINTRRFQVPDRNALDLLAKEQKFQLSDWADDAKSAQMGKVLNADYIARVIVIPDGSAATLMVRVLDVNTANGIAAEVMEFTTPRDARNKMDEFVSRIIQRIDGKRPKPPPRPKPAPYRPAPPSRPSPRPMSDEAKEALKTVVSFLPHYIGAGSSFTAPQLSFSLYNHKILVSNRRDTSGFLIDYGCDFGLFHSVMSEMGIKDVSYYSLYPNAHVNWAVGELEDNTYFHIGIGGGCMISTFQYPKDTVHDYLPAMDIIALGYQFKYLDMSYCLRTNFSSMNHKLSVGFRIPY